MEYVTLGNSELQVSKLCLGTMGFGDSTKGTHTWTLSQKESADIIGHSFEQGINFIDTAIGYSAGTSEVYVGKAIRDLGIRNQVVLATKFYPRTEVEILEGKKGVTHILELLDQSLYNLGTDYIDLYICHMWDYHTPMEEMMEAFHIAIQAGKIRAAGISNSFAWQVAKANALAKANGWEELVSMQGHYNLLFREEEREMLPFCASEGMRYTAYSPLAAGRLVKDPGEVSKRLKEDFYAKGKYDATQNQDSEIIGRVSELAEKKGCQKIHITLGWLLDKKVIPIIGATKCSHVEDALGALDITFTREEIRYLEEAYLPHALVGVMAENR